MEEATLGLDATRNDQFSLFESFTAALESFERNLKDEFAGRAAKDREILTELQALREDSSAFKKRQTHTSRHHAGPEVEVEVSGRQSSPNTNQPEDRDWHEEYRKLSDKHGKLRSERDELSKALETFKERRKEERSRDAETIRLLHGSDGRSSKRSSSKELEQPPNHPRSGALIPSTDSRKFPLSEFEVTPKIPGNEPPHATPLSDPPEPDGYGAPPSPFEELNFEPTSSESNALRLLAPQNVHHNEDNEPPELPPVRLIRNGHAEPLQVVDSNDRLPPIAVRNLQQKQDTPSSISTSSQSSQSDGLGDDTTLIGIPSDTPVVVFARPVKRKRRADSDQENPALIKIEPGRGSPGDPLQVKSEQGSSSPYQPKGQLAYTNNSQALDLDDVQSKVPTPKKLNRIGPQFSFEDGLRSSTALDVWRNHGRATSAPASNTASQSQREQLEINLPQAPNSGSALRPTDTNQKLHASSPDSRANRKAKRQKQDLSRGAAALPSISEDGDISDEFDGLTTRRARLLNPSTDTAENTSNPEIMEAKEKSKERLDTLLDHPSPARGPMTPLAPSSVKKQALRTRAAIGSHTTVKVPRKQLDVSGFIPTSLRDLPTTPVVSSSSALIMENNSVSRSNQHSRNSSRSSRATDSAAVSKTRSTPLRTLPLERLTTDHFQINPARNKGVAYAYTEVVRGKDQRKCLPGCTRPDCCGAHFRRLVEMSGFEVRADQSLWDPEGEDEGIRLIMEYMQWNRARVEELGEDERERLLIDAKIQKASNIFGKHRHLHERPASPPGFWNTDFPSTQERNKNRALANEMEREKVEVRWREAIKTKGLWKFADE